MKAIIIIYIVFKVTNICAQDYKQKLIGHTWQITNLKIGDDLFAESSNTCVYSTEISFINDYELILFRPCIATTQQRYNITNNLLIISSTDTLIIQNINKTSFETAMRKKATDNDGQVYVIDIVTTYEKK